MIAYVVEDRNLGTLGRDIVFYASKRYPQLETRRMDWMYARNSIFQYRSLPLPSVILVPVDQNTVDWFVYTYIHLFLSFIFYVKSDLTFSLYCLLNLNLFDFEFTRTSDVIFNFMGLIIYNIIIIDL